MTTVIAKRSATTGNKTMMGFGNLFTNRNCVRSTATKSNAERDIAAAAD